MAELFSSTRNMRISARVGSTLREEIYISSLDAQRFGIGTSGQYCIFAISPLYPGPGDQEFAARMVIDSNTPMGILQVNNLLLANAEIQEGDHGRDWLVRSAPAIYPVNQVVIEHTMDQGSVDKEISDLRFRRREFFVDRCMLVEPNKDLKDLTLRISGRGAFYLRDIQPHPRTLTEKSILVFGENTQINLFLPHRKSGVDMVVVVDGSRSMDHEDFLLEGRWRSRLDGVRNALDLLFQVRLVSGSRISSMAVIGFGKNTKMLYPIEIAMERNVNEGTINKIHESVRLLNDAGLIRLGVDRSGTEISSGLKLASDLLDLYAQENNERVIVLLSDGANWSEDTSEKGIGEVVPTGHDPAVLADNLRLDHEIRIHTIAISDETTYRKRYPQNPNQKDAIPNKILLKKIAENTDGFFLESPSADALAQIFEDLGEGSTYPIN